MKILRGKSAWHVRLRKFSLHSCMLGLSFIMCSSSFAGSVHEEIMDKSSMLKIAENGKSNAVIVLPPNSCPILRFAASELSANLKKVTGAEFPVVEKPDANKINLMLGEKLANAAGLKVDGIPCDGFIIQSKNNNIYIAGRDDEKGDPVKEAGGWCKWERGTLYAVYDFLERFAGVRFYFPGEMGTVTPQRKTLTIPAMKITEAPDFTKRTMSSGVNARSDGIRKTVSLWYEGTPEERANVIAKDGMNKFRLRCSSMNIPSCHGLTTLGYRERFAESHPEYFALTEKGERYTQPLRGWDSGGSGEYGHLCFSNPALREQIYKDAKAYLTGKSAAEAGINRGSRGGVSWPGQLIPGYFDIMPNDSFYKCQCVLCKPIHDKGAQATSDYVWAFAKELALKLKNDNVPGYLTMMSYNPHHLVPSFDLTDNIMVVTAVVGPWSLNTPRIKQDNARIQKWNDKTKTKAAWLWTYPGDPYGQLPDLPMMTPKSVGEYFKLVAPLTLGAYMEAETDHYIFQYLNYYMFSRVAWNSTVDVDAILDEHYRLMFGSGAEPMKKTYEELEKCWLATVARFNEEIGSHMVLPNEVERWTKIYSEDVVNKISSLLDAAEKQTASEPEALARVRFMRRELFGPMFAARKKWVDERKLVSDWSADVKILSGIEKISIDGKSDEPAWKSTEALALKAMGKVDGLEIVQSSVKVLRDEQNLYVFFNFNEPRINELSYSERTDGDSSFWGETEAEVLISPTSGKLYQYAFSPCGSLRKLAYKMAESKMIPEKDFKSQALVKCSLNDKGWTAEISIPLSELGGIRPDWKANFCYQRVLKNHPKMDYAKLYSWSPYSKQGFAEVDNFGRLILINKNLIHNGDFKAPLQKNGNIPDWAKVPNPSGNSYQIDKSVSYNDYPSMKLISAAGDKTVRTEQRVIGMKPNIRYSLSAYVKLADVKPADKHGGVYITVHGGGRFQTPDLALNGTAEWTKLVKVFTTAADLNPEKCYIYLCLYNATGEAWFSNIRLEELSSE